jgi:penicillin G amidase
MMRIIGFLLSLLFTAGLIYVLDTRTVIPAPLGKLLSPQEGLWQNAEPVNAGFDDELRFPELKGKVEVFIDERLVPHVFAEDDHDAYFVQGYLHAKFRLWQMEFQTHAAAGRISEIIGDKAISYDRTQRRMGMVYGAENALKEMEKDPQIKASIDAYTAGVNAYIATLNSSELPVEYKLLGYKPEKWSNFKTALFTKAMTNDLAGYDRDFEFTHALQVLGEENFRMLFPEIADSLAPIIPKGTPFSVPVNMPEIPAKMDSVYLHRTDSILFTEEFKPNPANGSNNWAVSGSRTKSGRPILSNDPHLRLSLPAIWFEMQLHTPGFNSYGVSFPGIPGIVIGFNDNIAFGFTNSGRDVKDYYDIKFKDETRQEYWFNNSWRPSENRVEEIKVKGAISVLDTVSYTVFGPVMYDKSNEDVLHDNRAYALRWVAHDPSNILKMWHLLNRAKNYDDYLAAIKYFNVPGQNMLFASKNGDIALWQQATFPLRWKDQGLFVMPGQDSSYMWKGFIPQSENPHLINPEEGFISSANQRPVDAAYPYFIPGSYDVYRGIIINRRLAAMQNVTPEDMMKLQNDNYNVFAEYARPVLLKNIDRSQLDQKELDYLDILTVWNLRNDPLEKAPTIFINWWDSLQSEVFTDELNQGSMPVLKPEKFVLLEGLLRDSAFKFIDDISTNKKETLEEVITSAFKKAVIKLREAEEQGKLEWAKYKNTTVYHLLRTGALPFARAGLLNGGGTNIINATTHDHGPSWRMVIHMTDEIEAYAVYPGGQQGNPGSRYYDNFIDTWTKGEYYRLWIMTEKDKKDKKVKWKITFRS